MEYRLVGFALLLGYAEPTGQECLDLRTWMHRSDVAGFLVPPQTHPDVKQDLPSFLNLTLPCQPHILKSLNIQWIVLVSGKINDHEEWLSQATTEGIHILLLME